MNPQTTAECSGVPEPPQQEPSERLVYSGDPFVQATHYLLRYPAKFHPPVVRRLIENFTTPGQLILDPFCGSGTLLVEASMLRRRSVGTDVDPLAVLASNVKSTRVRPGALERSADKLLTSLSHHRRSDAEYERRQFEDYSETSFRAQVTRRSLQIPPLPNLFHWFRKYVIVDLAVIKRAISDIEGVSPSHRAILMLAFASTIRKASNADPVPVSGLEVTKHMRKREAKGRTINPFLLFEQEVRKACVAFREYWRETAPGFNGRAHRMDARRMSLGLSRVDAIITSPPYHGAVDYYRRHTLEAYWLDFASSPEDRLALLPQYIGRDKVPQSHEFAKAAILAAPYLAKWEQTLRTLDPRRADAFRHYALSMQMALGQAARLLGPGALAIFVVGNSRWKGEEIDTSRLLIELGHHFFRPIAQLWYPLKNRYMSYSRHNGASIDREHVLILERTTGERQ